MKTHDQKVNDDFMAQLRAQSHAARQKDIASNKLLTGDELAARLHWAPAALAAAVRTHRMFSLHTPAGIYYPAFFADEQYDRDALEETSLILGAISGERKWEFFMNPRRSLNGQTPLGALAQGRIEAVLAVAVAFADE